MRTAAEFNQYYSTPDPWGISRATFRDSILRRAVAPFISSKAVLELGCGEGRLTQTIFKDAKRIVGVDISSTAIDRAKALNLANAQFITADFLDVPFFGFDVIAAIECLYYLTARDQEVFFEKLAAEHRGVLILSGPITGGRYFTHETLMATFARHGLSVVNFSNLSVRFRGARFCPPSLISRAPDWLIRQRCYVAYLPRVSRHP